MFAIAEYSRDMKQSQIQTQAYIDKVVFKFALPNGFV